jgi:hypothetical protein
LVFVKVYWFSSSKGFFRLRVVEGDVLAEYKPNKFISLRQLFATRRDYIDCRSIEEKLVIRSKHIALFDEMIVKLKGFSSVDEQDVYIKEEMRSQGYSFYK